jgi:hypothetical protein
MRTKALLHTTTCADCKREDPPVVKAAAVTICINGIPRGFCVQHLIDHKDPKVRAAIKGEAPEIEALIEELMMKGV